MSWSASALFFVTLVGPFGPLVPPDPEAGAPSSRVTFLGWAREIPRSRSASRDAPAFNLMVVPRIVQTASGEFALLTIPTKDVTVRVGFYGLIDLEREGEAKRFKPLFPKGGGSFFWRAAYGYGVATSFDSWAHKLCDRCAIETALMYRHESEHTTGSNSGEPGADFSDRPIIGDLLLLDAAVRWASGDWVLVGRVQHELFIPGRSSYSHGPGIDLYAGYKAWRSVHLFTAGFAENLFGTQTEGRAYPDAYLVRGLLGVALPSSLGDIEVYLSGDIGHRKGLLTFTEERTLGFGIRLALGPLSKERDARGAGAERLSGHRDVLPPDIRGAVRGTR